MKYYKYITEPLFLLIVLFQLLSFNIQGHEHSKINPLLLNNKWDAQWISYPDVSLLDYGVYHFRKTFNISEKPSEFIIHVSGDNRYRLFINGNEVCNGPARGDLANWRFESIDIAKYLKIGDNVLSSVVWNFGVYKPLAQISNKTAFIVQGNDSIEARVNTNNTWKVYKNEAYISPVSKSSRTVVGLGVNVDGNKYPYGWEQINYNSSFAPTKH